MHFLKVSIFSKKFYFIYRECIKIAIVSDILQQISANTKIISLRVCRLKVILMILSEIFLISNSSKINTTMKKSPKEKSMKMVNKIFKESYKHWSHVKLIKVYNKLWWAIFHWVGKEILLVKYLGVIIWNYVWSIASQSSIVFIDQNNSLMLCV